MKKKAELRKKQRSVYVNEDLTPLRNAIFNIAREHDSVKNVATRDGKIVARMKDRPDRPIYIDTPDDLSKIGVIPDWKRLKLDHLMCIQE